MKEWRERREGKGRGKLRGVVGKRTRWMDRRMKGGYEERQRGKKVEILGWVKRRLR